MLNVNVDFVPPFASTIIFELRVKSDDKTKFEVSIYYNGDPLSGAENIISFDKLKAEFMKDYLDNNAYNKACNNPTS